MYYCNDCCEQFRDPEVTPVHIIHDELDSQRMEKIHEISCPYCGGNDIERMGACMMCGEPVIEGKLCDVCRDDLYGIIDIYAEKRDIERETVLDGLTELLNE